MDFDVTVSSQLLAAVAEWSDADQVRPHLRQVAFRGRAIVATDGCRIVKVPDAVPEAAPDLAFGLSRADVLAAVAVQNTLADATKAAGGLRLPARRRRRLRIARHASGKIDIWISADDSLIFHVEDASESSTFPPYEELFRPPPTPAVPAPGGTGIALYPRFLASFQPIIEALDLEVEASHRPVRVVSWGGPTDPTWWEGPAGVQFVIMPMMEAP